MLNEEEILKKYKLSDEEHDRVYTTIKNVYTAHKFPVENPVCVIVGGQTGSGKSGILGYSQKLFADNNVIVLNSDEIKPYHPNETEIAKCHPDLYTKITDQESNTWTSKLFEDLRNEKYNIIFEGTMWNNRIADDAIVKLIDLGYTVIVRGLATSELESKLSVLERYIGEKKHKGFGRLVTNEHHDRTYNGMPNTIDYIESNGRYSILEIFVRGTDNPSEPQLIYSNINKDRMPLTQRAIVFDEVGKTDQSKVSLGVNKNGFESAKDAVLKGRIFDTIRVIPTVKSRIEDLEKYESAPELLDKIPSLAEAYQRALEYESDPLNNNALYGPKKD